MPRKTHGKQSNWRAGDADPDETRREQLAALMYVKEMQERSWAHTMTLELRLGDKSDKSPTLMTIFCFLFSLFWYSSIRHGPAASTHLGGVAKRLIKIKNDFIIYFSSDNRGAACFVFTSLFTSISACRCRSLFVSLSAQSLCQCLYTSRSHSLSQSVSHPHPRLHLSFLLSCLTLLSAALCTFPPQGKQAAK